MGVLLERLDRRSEALQQYIMSRSIYSKVMGDEHQIVARVKGRIGGVLQLSGDLDGALQEYEGVICILKAKLGEKHADVVSPTPYTLNPEACRVLSSLDPKL